MTQPKNRIETALLGTLRLNDEIAPNHYEYATMIRSGKRPVKLFLYSDIETGNMDKTIRYSSTLCQSLPDVSESIKQFIVEEVLPAINEHLRADDPLSASEFWEELRLSIIHVHANGDASFWFDPNELMLDHCLILYGNYDGVISHFDMPG